MIWIQSGEEYVDKLSVRHKLFTDGKRQKVDKQGNIFFQWKKDELLLI